MVLRTPTLALLIGLMLGPALSACAADPKPPANLDEVKPQDRRAAFRALDTDGDGWVSRREAQARPEVVANFDTADSDHDGRLSFEEFEKIPVGRTDQPGLRMPNRG